LYPKRNTYKRRVFFLLLLELFLVDGPGQLIDVNVLLQGSGVGMAILHDPPKTAFQIVFHQFLRESREGAEKRVERVLDVRY